jgi:hypothetical protein
MGYLADIVRDSRRVAATAAPWTYAAAGALEAPAESAAQVGTRAPAPAAERGRMQPIAGITEIEFRGDRESDAERAVATPPSAETAFRKAGPSQTEYTKAIAELPKVTNRGSTPSRLVTHKQAGRASDRTATGDLPSEANEFHDGVLENVSFGVNRSTVRDLYAEQTASFSTGKASVETQRRRTGTFDPPEPFSGSSFEVTRAEEGADPATGRGLPEPPAAAEAEARISNGDREPAPRREEAAGQARQEPPARSGAVSHYIPAAAALDAGPHPRERQRPAEAASKPPAPPSEPRVHIGAVEIVVATPPPRQPRAAAASPPDLASRHYLRNI